jgi:hypothetical protein
MKKQLLMRAFVKIVMMGLLFSGMAQRKSTIAIVSMDTKGVNLSNDVMADVVRLELEKTNLYEVLDKYDVNDVLKANQIIAEQSFGKNAMIKSGELLQADKMLTGSVELFGDKIILILRLVDIQSKSVEATSVMEYLNVPAEIQTMALISLNDLLGIKNDPQLVDLLINYNLPITTMKTTAKLNGPRMGATLTTGSSGQRLQAARRDGGYNMFPVSSMFGYQFEKQYISSGDFQALIETIVAINGLESGAFIPSVAVLNGFRFNRSGFELGVGPNFRMVKLAEGFYQDGNWTLLSEVENIPEGVEIEELLDNRGDVRTSLGLLVAVGKTFRSGYLNIPVNVFCAPRKNGTTIGLTVGFNTAKKPKI